MEKIHNPFESEDKRMKACNEFSEYLDEIAKVPNFTTESALFYGDKLIHTVLNYAVAEREYTQAFYGKSTERYNTINLKIIDLATIINEANAGSNLEMKKFISTQALNLTSMPGDIKLKLLNIENLIPENSAPRPQG